MNCTSYVLIFYSLIFLLGCIGPFRANEPEISLPVCINNKLAAFKINELCSNASVNEYLYVNTVYFAFSNGDCGCCDKSIVEYYDANCNQKMSIGGFAGKICSDTNFCKIQSQLVLKRNIWKK